MARWDWNVMDGLIPKALKAPLLCIEVPVSLILMRCVPRAQQFFFTIDPTDKMGRDKGPFAHAVYQSFPLRNEQAASSNSAHQKAPRCSDSSAGSSAPFSAGCAPLSPAAR